MQRVYNAYIFIQRGAILTEISHRSLKLLSAITSLQVMRACSAGNVQGLTSIGSESYNCDYEANQKILLLFTLGRCEAVLLQIHESTQV